LFMLSSSEVETRAGRAFELPQRDFVPTALRVDFPTCGLISV
jgi:hypothetical protein